MPSKISWTDETLNVNWGCTKVSDGCKHCYAERVTERFFPKRRFNQFVPQPHVIDQPFHWARPRRVFVNSMSDLFHEDQQADYLDLVFGMMAACRRHTFMVLTKRPREMQEYFRPEWKLPTQNAEQRIKKIVLRMGVTNGQDVETILNDWMWPLPNLIIGTSVENERIFPPRVNALINTSARWRFISAEPLLGPINLNEYLATGFIHQVIVGGESGGHMKGVDNPRHMQMQWARAIKEHCVQHNVAFFFKQASGIRPGMHPYLVEEDGSKWRWEQHCGYHTLPERVYA